MNFDPKVRKVESDEKIVEKNNPKHQNKPKKQRIKTQINTKDSITRMVWM